MSNKTLLDFLRIQFGNTVVDAQLLNGEDAAFYRNASNLNSGTLSSSLLPDLVVGDFAGAAIQTSSEEFSDSDTVLLTAAAIEDKILSYNYSTTVGTITELVAGDGLVGGGTDGNVTIDISTGDGLQIVSDQVAVDSTVARTNVAETFSSDLTVQGNLVVSGTTTTVNTEEIALADNIIVLNSNEAGAPSQNAGIEVERGTSTNVQLRWNEADDHWEFSNDGSNYTKIAVSTTDLAEGTNLYYTDARARAAISVDGDLSYNDSTGVVSFTERTDAEVKALFSAGGDLSYNSTTGEFSFTERTDAEVRGLLSATGNINYDANTGVISESLTSDDIDEGSNLYYTDGRARAAISVSGDLSYDANTGVISFTETTSISDVRNAISASGNINYDANTGVISESLTTDDIDEGSNLYFTDARARGAISAEGDLSYNSTTGVVSFTERTDAEVRGLIGVSGDLSYNPSTGVVSFTERTDSEVRGLISAGGDLSYDAANGVVSFTERTDAEVRGLISAGGDLSYDAANGVVSFTERTDAEVRGLISATGSLNYNNSTGEISFTERSNSEVRALLSGSGNINYNASTGVISESLTTDDIDEGSNLYYTEARANSAIDARVNKAFVDNLGVEASTLDGVQGSNYARTDIAETFTSDVTIQGDLTVSGNVTTVNTEEVNIADNIIVLNSNEAGAPSQNAGIEVERGTDTNVQLRWNEASDQWEFSNDGTNYTKIAESTSDLAEGTNLYYTDARARGAISVSGDLNYASETGVISFTERTDAEVKALISGSGNINYDANSGVISESLTTTDIDEGDNLYYTDSRVRSAISVSGDLGYDSANGVVSFTERTDAEVKGLFSAGGDLSYDSGTGEFSFTERTDAEVKGLFSAGGDLSYDSGTGEFSFTERTDSEVRGLISVSGDLSYDSANGVVSFTERTDEEVKALISATGNINYDANSGVISESLTSDDIDEGSNLYYTDARARAAISATGSLSYDSGSGEISFTERSNAEVRALFSASGNINYNASTGEISESLTSDDIDEGSNLYYTEARANSAIDARVNKAFVDALNVDADTLDGVQGSNYARTDIAETFTSDVTIQGDLTVSGNVTSVNTEEVNIADNIIVLNSNEAGAPSQNAGIEVERGTDTNVQLRWNEASDQWEFSNDGASYTKIAESTTDLAEGTNLYYTDARARAAISVSGDLSYNSGSGEISFTERTDAEVRGLISVSGDLSYDSANGIVSFTERTDAEVKGLISGSGNINYDADTGVISESLTTDDIDEGSNLYYTDARARDAISVAGSLSYDSANGVVSFTERSNSEVRALFSASGNINYNASTGEISESLTTDDIDEGSNLYYTDSRARNAINVAGDLSYDSANGTVSFTERTDAEVKALISATGNINYDSANGVISESLTSDDIDEGSNLYFTDARARSAISVSGDLSYDSANGVVSFTERTDSEVRGLLSGSGNIKYNASTGVISETLTTTDIDEGDNLYYTEARANSAIDARVNKSFVDALNVDADTLDGVQGSNYARTDIAETFTSDVTIQGDLTVSGNVTSVNTEEVNIADNIIVLNSNEAGAPSQNAGIEVERGTSDNVQLRWNEASDQWEFSNDGTNYTKISEDTDDLAEGSTNLYFTNSRARGAISVSGDLSYDANTGVISFTETTSVADVRNAISATGNINYDANTGVISESLTSDDIDEGSNLYYTDARARGAISVAGSLSYDSANGVVSFTERSNAEVRALLSGSGNINYNASTGEISESLTTTDIDEGDNLYFTDARARGAISVSGDLGYDAANGVVSFTERTDAEVKALISATGNINYDSANGVISESLTSDDIDEGSNLYFTDARARSAINVAGDLSYDSANGTVSFTERTDAEVKALLSGSGNIKYDANTGVISEQLTTTDIDEGDNLYYTEARANTAIDARVDKAFVDALNVDADTLDGVDLLNIARTDIAETFTNDVTVQGNLVVSGSVTTVNTEEVNIADNIIVLNSNEAGAPSQNAGIEVERGTDTNVQLRWNEADDQWEFSNDGASYTKIAESTTDLAEGTNLYYTDARARGAISVDGDLSYNSTTGVISFTERTDAEVKGLISGSGNINYDANSGVISESLTTDDIDEGSNLYFTDARARSAVSVSGDLSYDAANGVVSFTERTDAEVRALISAGGDLSYDATNGVVSFTERTDAEVRGLINVAGDLSYDSANGTVSFTERTDAEVKALISASGNINYDANSGVISESLTSDDIDEGSNLYYTDARARAAISATGDISYDANTGVISFTNDLGDIESVVAGEGLTGGGTSGNVTLDIGAGNGITVNADNIAVNMSVFDTDDLVEGTNLYYTDARARDAIDVSGDLSYNSSTGVISFTERTDAEVRGLISVSGDLGYDSGTGVISFTERTDAEVKALISGSGNINYDANTGVISESLTTTDIDEGDNLYFTDARARAAISVSGDLSYDSANGVVSFTERTDAEVKGLISASGNINYDANSGVISESLTTDDIDEGGNLYYTEARANSAIDARVNKAFVDALNVDADTLDGVQGSNYARTDIAETFTNDVTVQGNLIVSGNVTTVNTEEIALADNIIVLNSNEAGAPSQNAGIEIERGTSDNVQLRWNEADDQWEFSNDGASYTKIAESTSDLAEGTNLYYTDARARSAISVSGDLSYSSSTGVISFTERTDAEVRGLINVAGDLSYDSANGTVSFTERTDAEVRGLISVSGDLGYDANTGVISFTERTDAEVKALLSGSGNINYDANTGVISESLTTDDIDEGSNLYYTEARANSAIDARVNKAFVDALDVDADTLDGVDILNIARTDVDETFTANVVVDAALSVNDVQIATESASTNATAQTAVASFATSDYRSARFTIQISNTIDGSYQISEMLVIHNGTNAFSTEYGTIYTGTGVDRLSEFSVDISNGDVRLLATPISSDAMEYKIVRHSVVA